MAAIQVAAQVLEEKGFDEAEREEMLRPLLKLASNTDWTGRKGSVVMFRSPEFTITSPRAGHASLRGCISRRSFLCCHYFPGLLSKRDFWLLTLSINSVRLFHGASDGLVEVALPKDVESKTCPETKDSISPSTVSRGRSSAGPSVGNMKGVQFGTSSAHASELQKDYLHDFFKSIDRGIHGILAKDPQPLILAGVTRELAIYRSVNTYSPVLTGSVHGSVEKFATGDVHSKAVELMSAYSARAMDATLVEMEEAGNRGLLASDPAEVIEAANNGQIADLIVSPAASGFGQREGLINCAALATIRSGGKISVLTASRPGDGVAAVLRYRQAGQNDNEAPELALS